MPPRTRLAIGDNLGFPRPISERDWKDADLVAARETCHHKIDFAALLPKADRLLS